ncbi:MAG: 5'-nucleotidase C-terminal domain-containing protein [Pseudomonadota bacterium]
MKRLLLILFLLSGCAGQRVEVPPVWISVVGTNDVHGEFAGVDRGLLAFSGYVEALRQRRGDNGVVLIDGGDMWQGTLASNLNEGQAITAAYNALGYDAATVGNHEFDFGPVGDAAIPMGPEDDARGVIKQRASEADFALLAANLLNAETGRRVQWPGVTPTTMFQKNGVNIGVIGITTIDTLETTFPANTVGLRMAPLADTVAAEATALRAAGANLVIVAAHAGGHCDSFDDPYDLSSCALDDEIFQVAMALPAGLVDQIVAGHEHRPIAHVVNGIAITSNPSRLRSFGRVDYRIDPTDGRVLERRVLPPQKMCMFIATDDAACSETTSVVMPPPDYEGYPTTPNPDVRTIVGRTLLAASSLQSQSLNVSLTAPFTRNDEPDSVLGHMMTDAIREQTGADVSLHNVAGGIRADLPAGVLTFGDVYRVFPFDNRLSMPVVTVAKLKRLLSFQVHRDDRRVGISGARVTVSCDDGDMQLMLSDESGNVWPDERKLNLAANDFLMQGGDDIMTPIVDTTAFVVDAGQPMIRDIWLAWLKNQQGDLSPEDFELGESRWSLPMNYLEACPRPE